MNTYTCGWCLTRHPCQQSMTVYGTTYTCKGANKR
mgnify:CR=1 FL=1